MLSIVKTDSLIKRYQGQLDKAEGRPVPSLKVRSQSLQRSTAYGMNADDRQYYERVVKNPRKVQAPGFDLTAQPTLKDVFLRS